MSQRYTNNREHNPHAHVIHKPGRRLTHHLPLRFVWRKVVGMGSRDPNANLNLTAYIDVLLVTVIFLLTTFNASGQISVPKEITLGHIFHSIWPYLGLQIVALGLVIGFPQIALWLPSTMR